ncbi:UDP-N-acetylmuramate dehydrogenase [Pseudokineococcus marinus]|uniref:UDP-N-acetylenolpyruvoylglucosamine reductase n=3 Tax=Pseudokineococcus marinus TaxID=351215 RepID=A0A849BP63_9ACTN|nr:UDP-N-acetylmuramate dehydrogenase [Pseudokineococcus marinus]NNH24461.1 UDP-N-acetylmuramate dehydrogenase [Pseudokineococcus marinus]
MSTQEQAPADRDAAAGVGGTGADASTAPGAPLATRTTLRVGGRPAREVVARTQAELVDAVRGADARGEEVLLVAGGSNLLVADGDLPVTAVVVASSGLRREPVDACGGVWVTAEAGHPWEDLVAETTANGWLGLEALSGIPGSTGATPVQNVGAYGADVSGTLAQVRTWDRREGRLRTLAVGDLRLGYRTSLLKEDPDRYVVLDVTFQLREGELGGPVRYAELAARLGVPVGGRAPAADVREAVLALRRGKGMVLDDPAAGVVDHDTWSAGSFFTNPVLGAAEADALPEGAPRYPAEGGVKTSAAWLIAAAGFERGHGLPGPAALSTKHTLAVTNRGGASAQDVLALAREVRDGVAERFGVRLEPEPRLVGCSLG